MAGILAGIQETSYFTYRRTAVTEFVFVLGMGRSGTSALTRLLALCGASLPPRLLGATDSNLTGHWEPLDALMLNERFLGERSSNWYDPSLRVQLTAIDESRRETFISEITAFLDKCPKSTLVVIKEPRITALTEYWFEAVTRTGTSPKIVIPVRHPAEVAASLGARDGISHSLSNALWLKYNLLAERTSRGLRRAFVGYGNLLTNWRNETDRIAAALGVQLSPNSDVEVATFLRSDLRHHIANGTPVESSGPKWMADVYEALLAASCDVCYNHRSFDAAYTAIVDGTIDIWSANREFEARCSAELSDQINSEAGL